MSEKEFNVDTLRNMVDEMSKSNIVSYEELPRYDLFLSQVIDYLNDKFEGERYTNNIVQNYIKSDVILKPEDGKKRGYTKIHLAQLTLLSYMRPILTTEEIKKVFKLAFNEMNDRTDDIITWEKSYEIFSQLQEHVFTELFAKDYFEEEKLKEILKDCNLEHNEEKRITVFLTVMMLIAQASVIKKLAQKIVDEYGSEK